MSIITLTLPQKQNHGREQQEARHTEPLVAPLKEESHEERIERILNSDDPLTDEEFELLADELAADVLRDCGGKSPTLSDYAVSREGIYEDHL